MRHLIKAGLFSFIASLLFISACNVTKPIPDKEYLLIKNKIKIRNAKISSDDLTGYLQQAPNSRLFGLFRANIAFYNMGNKGKDTKFKTWLRKKLGSAPVLLDTALTQIAIKQMTLYINNIGYFNSHIYDSIVRKKKKASVYYMVNAAKPYRYRKINYSIPDKKLAGFVFQDTVSSLIKPGNIYNSYTLDEERTRITGLLQDKGYYKFTSSYIVYHIDSSLSSRQMDVTLEITNPVIPSISDFGTFVEAPHKQFLIHRIYIYTDFDPLESDTIRYDTLVKQYQASNKDTTKFDYYFLYHRKLKIKPRTIIQTIILRPGNYYSLSEVNKTYSNLGRLPIFRYKSIQFIDVTEKVTGSQDQLDCRIMMAREQVHSFTVSGDGTNSAGAFGLQGNVIYQNRSLFRGAQYFKLSLSASAQTQGSIGPSGGKTLFNTFELGANASLTLPQFLIPVRQETLPKKFKPKTIITLGYNYQQQDNYNRHFSNVTFGYTWNQNERLTHLINPIEISAVKVNPDSLFQSWLDRQTDKRLRNQYINHLVAGLRYTITYNTQNRSTVRDFFYIRANFYTGGNLLYAINSAFGGNKSGSSYKIADVPYAQFVRPDLDVRYYRMFSKNTSAVFRFYGGIGIPYGNSNALPFEKAFYGGGANDIRGWKMGTLGPGSYNNDTSSTSFNQIGDILLQGNIEYRFPVYKVFKSAVFIDAGNIWLLHDSPDLPGGKFRFSTLLPQIAISAGIGLRLDFDFFVFRLDPAIPIRVPHYPAHDRWSFDKMRISDIIWNFGIGYPF